MFFKFPLDLIPGRGHRLALLGPQFTFPFYSKDLIGVWYCNLRNPVKATSLGHPRHTEARPQYKASNIYQPEDWKVQIPSRKNKILRSCLLVNSRQPL
jgi:hypothetical protein